MNLIRADTQYAAPPNKNHCFLRYFSYSKLYSSSVLQVPFNEKERYNRLKREVENEFTQFQS